MHRTQESQLQNSTETKGLEKSTLTTTAKSMSSWTQTHHHVCSLKTQVLSWRLFAKAKRWCSPCGTCWNSPGGGHERSASQKVGTLTPLWERKRNNTFILNHDPKQGKIMWNRSQLRIRVVVRTWDTPTENYPNPSEQYESIGINEDGDHQ